MRFRILTTRVLIRRSLFAFLSLKQTLAPATGSFTLFGLDAVIDTDLNAHVMETNCNFQLFSNMEEDGVERLLVSKRLVFGMMDAVVATNWHAEEFKKLLEDDASKNSVEVRGGPGYDLKTSVGDDFTWELLYSESTTSGGRGGGGDKLNAEPWSFIKIGEGKCYP